MSYITEEQQVEELKNWWKENRTVIFVGLFLLITGVLGWRYWQNYQVTNRLQTSAQFEQVFNAYQQNPANNAQLLGQFAKEHKDSSYAVFALFEQAKNNIINNKLSAAEQDLQQAVNMSQDTQLNEIATLRLANIQIQLKKYTDAIQNLNNINEKAYDSIKQSLLGDAYFAQGDVKQARKAYNSALSNSNLDQLERDLITLHLNSL